MKLIQIIALWFISFNLCIAGEKENKAIKDAFPQVTIYSLSTGTIEGNTYFSAILENNKDHSLALFQLDKKNNYKLIAKSAWWAVHDRWYQETTVINNNSVYYSLKGNGGCCSDYSIQHQFKLADSQFMLVGTENSENGLAPDEKTAYKSGVSINYLTGQLKEYRLERPKVAGYKDDFFKSKGNAKITRERTIKFPKGHVTFLDTFDVWDQGDKEPRLPLTSSNH